MDGLAQNVYPECLAASVDGTAIFIEKSNEGKPGDYHYQVLASVTCSRQKKKKNQ